MSASCGSPSSYPLQVGDDPPTQTGNSTPQDSLRDETARLENIASSEHVPLHGNDQSSSPALGRFGDYELLHEIARGGMGVVYKARQVSLNRTVAIKMILRGTLAGGEDIERFTLEAKAVAKLSHPQIVVIHDVGQCDDQYFYSMEYVEGRSLAEMIRSGPVNCRKAAEYVEQVARAIDFAHQNNIVHRDIKPSNVLVDASGRARVTDFGLAKHVDRGEELTLTGQIIGTPAYMAPGANHQSPRRDRSGVRRVWHGGFTLRIADRAAAVQGTRPIQYLAASIGLRAAVAARSQSRRAA